LVFDVILWVWALPEREMAEKRVKRAAIKVGFIRDIFLAG
jgi:hypothetical protein